MRIRLILLLTLAASCGGEEKVVVRQPPYSPSPVMEQARKDALAAEREYLALGEAKQKLARDAWERAERARAERADDAAQGAYRAVTNSYRDAIEDARRAAAARAEKLYLRAVDARAAALATRKRVETLRQSLAAAIGQAKDDAERQAARELSEFCEREVFAPVLLEIDTALEKAKVFFDDKRYADAAELFDGARAELEVIPEKCDAAQARMDAEAARDAAKAARDRALELFRKRRLKQTGEFGDAAKLVVQGNERLHDGDFEGAKERYERARETYERAFDQGPVQVAAREEAVRTAKAAVAARKAWEEYAEGMGLDPVAPALEAQEILDRGMDRAKQGRFTSASKSFRAAKRAYDGLVLAAEAAEKERIRKVRQGPPPHPEGSFPSQKQRNVVRLALLWLSQHQDADGRWNSDDFALNDPAHDRCDGKGRALHDTGLTGLALTAFLRAGFPDRGKDARAYYAPNVRAGLRWLLQVQSRDDGVFGGRASRSFVYGHAMATRAMCEAYRLTKDARYGKSAQMGLNFLARARNPHFAWRYGPRDGENDTSVTAWCVEALDAGRRAGLEIDREAFTGALVWVIKMTDPNFGQVGYNFPGGAVARPEGLEERFPSERSQAMTAAALTIRLICGSRPDSAFEKGLGLLADLPPEWNPSNGSIDMYYWYWGQRAFARAAALRKVSVGVAGNKWEKTIREAILEHQHPVGSGSRTGSWDPIGVWGEDGGRVFSTAILALALIPGE